MVVGKNSRAKDNSSLTGQVVAGSSSSTSGAGRILSSGSGIVPSSSSASADVRQNVRDAWANRFAKNAGKENDFPTASGSKERTEKIMSKPINTGTAKNSKSSGKEEDTSPCPVCSRSVPNAAINDHLDECLTRASLGEETSEHQTEVNLHDEGADNDSRICPRCRREVLKEEFEFHRGVCL